MDKRKNIRRDVLATAETSKHRWTKREAIVFREVRETGVVTLHSSCEVVDIKVNEEALRLLYENKHLDDNPHVVTITWDTWDSPWDSLCEIHLDNDQGHKTTSLVLDLLRKDFSHLQSLIETLFRDYTARITYVQPYPCIFGFLHFSLGDFRRFENNLKHVEDIFRHLFSECASCNVQLSIKLQLCDHPHEKGEETVNSTYWNDDDDDDHLWDDEVEKPPSEELYQRNIDDSQMPDVKENETKVFPGDKGHVSADAVDDTEKKFRQIENNLQNQRKTIETKFEEQKTQNERMNETLEKLVQNLQNLPDPTDRQTQRTQHTSRPPVHITRGNSKDKPPVAKENQLPVKDNSKSSRVGSDNAKAERLEAAGLSREGTKSGGSHLRQSDTETSRSEVKPEKNVVGERQKEKNMQQRPSHQMMQTKSREPTHSAGMRQNQSLPDNMENTRHRMKPEEVTASSNPNLHQSGKPWSHDTVGGGKPRTEAKPNKDKEQPKSDNNRQTHKPYERPRDYQESDYQERTSTSHGGAFMFLSDHGVEGTNPETRRLQRAVEEAMIDHEPMPPRAQALDTVLCLDTSSSMGDTGLQEMKDIAVNFLEGIEDIAGKYETEENIAIVTFGGHSKIAHHLTNDYSSLRTTIENLQLGGRSPLFEALLVCLSAIRGRGGVLSISGLHLVSPRIIIITDGKASDESEGSADVEISNSNVKLRIVRLISDFKTRDHTFPKPLVWIPAGRADKGFLKSLVELSNGQYLEGNQMKELCNYQRIQETVGKIFVYLQNEEPSRTESFETHIDALFGVFAPDFDSDDKKQVVEILKAKLDGKEGYGNPGFEADGFDNITELPDLPPLGTRVTRGPDWQWENQDTEGPGTIINHGSQRGADPGLLWVMWDNGTTQQYRYGQNNAYDVWETLEQPRNLSSDMPIEVGCEVTRGPDWKKEFEEQDGGEGCVGVVIRKNDHAVIKVRWKVNCHIGTYRYSTQGAREVWIRDLLEYFKDLDAKTSKTDVSKPKYESSYKEKPPEKGTWVWQWKDEGNMWHSYPKDINQKLEDSFIARPDRSCLIQKDGSSFRVLFKEMQEKSVDDQSRKVVRRINADK